MKLTFQGASIIHTLMGIRIVLQKNSRKETQSQEIQSGQENAHHGSKRLCSRTAQNLADDPPTTILDNHA